ncbi:hypothetical protein E6C27_scaffold89G003620 [Cucumis melo var. makuwa]|uniref:Uncharacterized protein n=1 Tax=Cucumis melo var. makuwa TaxID=1194695 RepID=A0A5A7V6A9_CUCMM|nr:hypothetical protein E6C27_scaffold89G003620 [Cucumis melo var. makuwa]
MPRPANQFTRLEGGFPPRHQIRVPEYKNPFLILLLDCLATCNTPNFRGIKELTFKFSGSVAGLFGDSFPFLGVDSIEGHNQVSGKGFPTTGPRIEAGNVVIHRGLHVSNVTASCSLCAIGCKELFTDRHRCPDVLYIVVMLMGYVVNWNCMSMDFKVLRLGVSFGITRLICASFEITRLICASFGITRLICASFGITRRICASFGITRLIGKGTTRGRPTRGKKDARRPYGRVWFSLCFR